MIEIDETETLNIFLELKKCVDQLISTKCKR